ncbi:MAG TPA: redoxin domain-containing protein [Pirellulales bacterium]|nr:redoxin domain-containing protein [Pirellulales bacterium]
MHTLASLLVACSAVLAADSTQQPPTPVGKHIENFKLQDYLGAEHQLANWSGKKAVVVAFLGTECPLSLLYGPRLAELAKEYEPRDVAFIGIDSNRQDSLAEIAHYARVHGIEFTLLKDPGNTVADQFGAQRTPEVFLLDGERTVRYRGRIDDQYGFGYARPEPERRDLVSALDQVLAGDAVATAATKAAGCLIGREIRKPPTGDITYTKHVAGIFNSHCVRCHRKGEIGPFTLTSYDDVLGWTAMIREVIDEGRMPPWHANPKFGHFSNDSRLSDEEKRLVFEWIDNGSPEGDAADLPPPPKFVEGWRIPQPDLVFSMPEPYTVPAKGVVPYQHFETEVEFDEDKWIQAAEVRPGNRSVVHHLIVYYVPPGENPRRPELVLFNSLAAYSPGMPASEFGPRMAKLVPKGSKLVIQAHYTPNGSEQVDQSVAGLVFADPKDVERELRTKMLINVQFEIPPGATEHRVEAEHRFGQDTFIYSLLPHMHLRGKSFRLDAHYPDGRKETVLDVPRYDFNWQNSYVPVEPLLMPEGTVLHGTATFDNSADNLMNPDATKPVRWGDQTWEEMMVATFETVPADQDLTLGAPAVTHLEDDQYEARFVYRPDAAAEAVYLAGSFNDWQSTAHPMDGPDAEGRYTTTLKLNRGRYEYKYVLGGKKWRSDPANPKRAGMYNNSVLNVGE